MSRHLSLDSVPEAAADRLCGDVGVMILVKLVLAYGSDLSLLVSRCPLSALAIEMFGPRAHLDD